MISGPHQRVLFSSCPLWRGAAAERVVTARSGVGIMDDDGRGDKPSDWL